MSFEIANEESSLRAKIRVVGVGGGGCNAVNTMIKAGLTGVEYIVANTDAQALESSLAPTKIQLGVEITKGLGAGANPEIGRKSALEEYEKLSEVLTGSDMVFITSGMGGGTGTGAAPIVAGLARELGALTVGVVTKPFLFEGKKRCRQADAGISTLEESVDSLIIIPNQRLLQIAGESLSLVETFKKADDVLLNAVQGIADLITNTGLINADFADVNTIMANKGLSLMGTGVAEGSDRAIKAATLAISSPLLEDITIDGATGLIINITANSSLTAHETNEAVTLISSAADEEAEIIFGTVIDESIEDDKLKVTVIATGLGGMIKRAGHILPRSEESKPEINTQEPAIEEKEEKNTWEESIVAREVEEAIPEQEFSMNTSEMVKEAATQHQAQKFDNEGLADYGLSDTGASRRPEAKPETSSRTLSIAEKLGFLNFDEEELDKPTFLRNEGRENELNQ